MYCINLGTHDPHFNLAVEELLLKNSKEEYVILCINNPSVIIGKHQSGHREVNTDFVSKFEIPVIRRISGGGTVFHDSGNLNFSFIRQSESGKQINFRKYTQPVVDFLRYMGVMALLEGKNDLKVEGLKISGNAEHVHRNRVLHHGTLLFSASMDMLRNSLKKDTSCYTTRAIISNPAPVINLNEKINCFQDINEFRSEMINYFLKNLPDVYPYDLSQTETLHAELLANSKYRTWEWNWAYGPEYTFNKSFEIQNSFHSCHMVVKEGLIDECSIEGSDHMKIISKKLIGCRHMVSDMSEAFRNENIFLTEKEIFNFF